MRLASVALVAFAMAAAVPAGAATLERPVYLRLAPHLGHARERARELGPIARAAYASGSLALGAAVLLLLRILWLRAARRLQESRTRRSWHRWRPVLTDWLVNGSGPTPPLRSEEQVAFLMVWNEAQESVRGDARQRLNSLARALDLESVALRLLDHRDLATRLWAALALGNLESWAARPRLYALALDVDPWLSFAAARALVRIHPARAVRELMPHFVLRLDWARSRVLTVLREAGPEAVSVPLLVAIATTPEDRLPRALSFTSAARSESLRPAILYRLRHTDDPQVIAAALRHHRDPRDLPMLRRYCDHPSWFVRVQAVRAVGALGGGAEDRDLLVRRLDDQAWWVAFRAAEALAGARFSSELAACELTARAQAMLDEARRERRSA